MHATWSIQLMSHQTSWYNFFSLNELNDYSLPHLDWMLLQPCPKEGRFPNKDQALIAMARLSKCPAYPIIPYKHLTNVLLAPLYPTSTLWCVHSPAIPSLRCLLIRSLPILKRTTYSACKFIGRWNHCEIVRLWMHHYKCLTAPLYPIST